MCSLLRHTDNAFALIQCVGSVRKQIAKPLFLNDGNSTSSMGPELMRVEGKESRATGILGKSSNLRYIHYAQD